MSSWYTYRRSLSVIKMLPHINLSVDVVILGTFALVVLFGFALGQERLRSFALTIYVGLALAYELSGIVGDFVNGHGQSFAPASIRLSLFVAPILFLAFGKHSKSKKHQKGLIITLVTSVLIACLIVASYMHLMDPKTTVEYLNNSQIATQLFNLRLVWLAAVPIAIIVGMFIKPKGSH